MATRYAFRVVDAPIISLFTFIGECSILLWDSVRRLFTSKFEWEETVREMAFVGVASLPIVALTCFFSGAVLALYSAQFLVAYGAGNFVGATTVLAAIREIAPVLSGVMVTARCGSAMAAQIGSMAVTEQIDALLMLSVQPANYLVTPRLIAGFTMLPVLTLCGMFSAGVGGELVAAANGVPAAQFISSVQQYVTPHDLIDGMLKTPVFGVIIALVACQQGLRTKQGAVGVGRATTNTVVISMVLVYIANYLLSAAFFIK